MGKYKYKFELLIWDYEEVSSCIVLSPRQLTAELPNTASAGQVNRSWWEVGGDQSFLFWKYFWESRNISAHCTVLTVQCDSIINPITLYIDSIGTSFDPS